MNGGTVGRVVWGGCMHAGEWVRRVSRGWVLDGTQTGPCNVWLFPESLFRVFVQY